MDGKQIPKGWSVEYNILLTHELDPVTQKNNGSHMDTKQGFSPEDWLHEDNRPTADSIPMGVGTRYCLGSALAYIEMKVFLAIVARVLNFELVQDTDKITWKKFSIIPKPAEGEPI